MKWKECFPLLISWRSGQVVRRRSRKPKITGSNPVCAFSDLFCARMNLALPLFWVGEMLSEALWRNG